MATHSSLASTSLKEYLKRYENNHEEEKKKKKKKKKAKRDATGVVIVDEDPVWQKSVKIEEDEKDDSADDEKPLVDEDIEVKRMKRLEQLRSKRPFGTISEDGSGWVSISDTPKQESNQTSDISPREHRIRMDTPSPSPEWEPSRGGRDFTDLSPPRKPQSHHQTHHNSLLEPETEMSLSSHQDHACLNSTDQDFDISPPRKRRARYDTPSPGPNLPSESGRGVTDLSPPWKQKNRHSPSSEPERKQLVSTGSDVDFSPPRRPDRRKAVQLDSPGNSPPRWVPDREDLSPPRRGKKDRAGSRELSPRRSTRRTAEIDASRLSSVSDLSPQRHTRKESITLKERPKTGLITGRDIKEENEKTRKDELERYKGMDPLISGRGAEPVYRDKVTGAHMSKEEIMKSKQKDEKPKEIKLEWGKGLAQKREAEERQLELELEKDKPFARTRDDPELDRMLKGRVRWGDPMAHLVKRKQYDHLLPDLGANEKMKESGFIVPQEIPSHSWLRRGLDAASNRYGIKPGRHWDGVDRSNGFEKELFKRMNEKRATEREAYLWSVSDM
ncbi:hypothetical protein NMG60_11024340 [Bertholletia excelsa]